MKPKLLFLDLETTGVDPIRCGIVQIAAILDVGGKTVGEFDSYVAPFARDAIQLSALEMLALTMEDLIRFPAPPEVYHGFTSFLKKYIDPYNKRDKAFVVGYNAMFDDAFLREFFKKNDNKYYGSFFHWPTIDVAVLAATVYMKQRRDFENFKLITVAETILPNYEILPELTHTAKYDVNCARQLYYYLAERIDFEDPIPISEGSSPEDS